ncbi:proton-conducting transporter membrane subunit [Thaumasiovibrio subtropicus]|uniref:proton-conducting transporter transmembrane domain-containing protein n=1 Tax=Thaumasiovibrio subtropicus TaxID=1891207 RepID=UPI000B35926F|nr:proton-conducting transporter membrane subunit [Thaumasiovibrio subtropicus]
MSDMLLTLPVIIPLIAATAGFFIRHSHSWATRVGIGAASLSMLAAIGLMLEVLNHGPQAVAFGSWSAPFGIVFAADILGAAMALITTIIGLATVIYASADLNQKPSYGMYHMLFQVLLAGVSGAFLTGDIFNLYVWFEVMLIASFGLMVLDAKGKQIDGAVKYVVLNLVSTLAFLLAIGLLYGATGTLNLADLYSKAALIPSTTATFLCALFLFGFAIKSALFPVFAWLPASYHTLPSGVVALFAALLTKVGVYALIRLFTLVFPLDQSGMQPLLLVIAGLTMLTGVLGAASQFAIKRILSFHIISQIGYMVMGLALFTPLALAGMIFYLIHHIIVKANLFLIGGFLARKFGSDNLGRLGGIYKSKPWLAVLFLIPAFSLAGFPPLSGFWGKFLVIKASFQTEHYLLGATALLVGLLTVFSMTKIWNEAFWKAAPEEPTETLTHSERVLYIVPMVVLAALTVTIGLAAEPFYQVAVESAEQLLDPTPYIQAVLGVTP